MFKRSLIVLSLLLAGSPAMAVDIPLGKSQEKFILDLSTVSEQGGDVRFLDETGAVVGHAQHTPEGLTFKGVEGASFAVQNVPDTLGDSPLDIDVQGDLDVDTSFASTGMVLLNVANKLDIKQGFDVTGPLMIGCQKCFMRGACRGQKIVIGEKIITEDMPGDPSHQKCALKGSSALIRIMGDYVADFSEFTSTQMINNGNFSSTHVLLKADEVKNLKIFKAENCQIEAGKVHNSGEIHIAHHLSGKGGAWQNLEKGVVEVGHVFSGKFDQYADDGATTVFGIADITATRGRMTGHFKGNVAFFKFDDPLLFQSKALLDVASTLRMTSKGDITFRGRLSQRSITPENTLPTSLQHKINTLGAKGIYLDAGGDLDVDQSLVLSLGGNIHLRAAGNYSGARTQAQSGVFAQNDLMIEGVKAVLHDDHLRSFGAMHINGTEVVLSGHRQATGSMVVNAKETLRQKARDEMRGAMIQAHGQNIYLAGVSTAQSGSVVMQATKTLKQEKNSSVSAKESLHLSGITGVEIQKGAQTSGHQIAIDSTEGDAIIAGALESEILTRVDAGQIDIQPQATLKSSGTNAFHSRGTTYNAGDILGENNMFTHEAGLVHTGLIDASDTFASSGGYYTNGLNAWTWPWHRKGSVRAKSIFLDERQFVLDFFGNTSAKQMVVNADWFNLTAFSNISVRDYELNTTLNLGVGSRVAGHDHMRVNALLSYTPYSLHQSTHYTLNALRILPSPGLFVIPGIPSFSDNSLYKKDKSWVEQPLWRQALSGLTHLSQGVTKKGLMATQTFLGMSDLFSGVGRFAANLPPVNQMHRLSRLTKLGGGVMDIVMPTYQLSQSAPELLHGSLSDMKAGTATDFLRGALQPTATTHSIWDGDQATYLSGHVTKRSWYLDDQSTKYAFTANTVCYSGRDTSTFHGLRASVYAAHDLTVGGTKEAYLGYSAVAGNDLHTVDGTSANGGKSILFDAGRNLSLGKDNSLQGETISLKMQGFDLGQNVHLIGDRLHIDALNIPDVQGLIHGTGQYSGVDITDHLLVTTGQNVSFEGEVRSASSSFSIHAPEIVTQPNTHITAPTHLGLYATQGDLIFGAGTSIGGGVFTDLSAAGDIHGHFEKTLETAQSGDKILGAEKREVTSVGYKGVNFLGGKGIDYEGEDLETGEKSNRSLGLRLKAGGKVKGIGMGFSAIGDIVVDAAHGYENGGHAQEFRTDQSKDPGKTRLKIVNHYDTALCQGGFHTSGRASILSSFGGIHQDAGFLLAGDGVTLHAQENIHFGVLKGRKGKITTRDNKVWGLFDTHDPIMNDFNATNMCVNQGDTPVRIWSAQGSINAQGLQYRGLTSRLSLKAINIDLARTILGSEGASSSVKASCDVNGLQTMKFLEAINTAAIALAQLRGGDYYGAGKTLINPSLTLGLDYVKTAYTGHMLGAGSIQTRDIEILVQNALNQRNGYAIDVTRNASIVAPIYNMQGAELAYSTKTTSAGLTARASLDGVDAGVRFSSNKTKGTRWAASKLTVGDTLSLKVGELTQDAGAIQTRKIEGGIEHLRSRTRQDVEQTKSWGFSATKSLTDQTRGTASLSFGRKRTRETTEGGKSGIQAATATEEGFVIGRATLEGAEVNVTEKGNVTVGATDRINLPKEYRNRGFAISTSGSSKGGLSLGAKVMNNGHAIGVDVPLSQEQGNSAGKIFTSMGNVSYENPKGVNLTMPLVTGVNRDAIKRTGENLLWAADKISSDSMRQPTPRVEGPKVLETTQNLESATEHTQDFGTTQNSLTPPSEAFNPNNIHQSEMEEVSKKGAKTVRRKLATPGKVGRAMRGVVSLSKGMSSKEVPTWTDVGGILRAPQDLESLLTPLEFQGHLFPYRMGNVYLECSALESTVRQIIAEVNANNSLYGKKACGGAFSDPELGIFMFKGKMTPFGNRGGISADKNLIGTVPGQKGSQVLNGDFIAISSISPDPVTRVSEMFAHEAAHHHQTQLTEGYFTPGFLAADSTASRMNQHRLMQAYRSDMAQVKRNGGITTPQLEKMFSAPLRYFNNELKSMFAELGISGSQVKDIVSIIQEELVGGNVPSQRWPHTLGPRLARAETEMFSEIPSYFTEADMMHPGIVAATAPDTHAILEEFEQQALKNIRPPHSLGRDMWQATKKLGPPLLIMTDFGVHIWTESHAGRPPHEALGYGLINTALDMGTYGQVYGALGPLAPAVAALHLAGALLPDYSIKDSAILHAQAERARNHLKDAGVPEWCDPRTEYDAGAEAIGMTMAVRGVTQTVGYLAEGVQGAFHAALPSVGPSISETMKNITGDFAPSPYPAVRSADAGRQEHDVPIWCDADSVSAQAQGQIEANWYLFVTLPKHVARGALNLGRAAGQDIVDHMIRAAQVTVDQTIQTGKFYRETHEEMVRRRIDQEARLHEMDIYEAEDF